MGSLATDSIFYLNQHSTKISWCSKQCWWPVTIFANKSIHYFVKFANSNNIILLNMLLLLICNNVLRMRRWQLKKVLKKTMNYKQITKTTSMRQLLQWLIILFINTIIYTYVHIGSQTASTKFVYVIIIPFLFGKFFPRHRHFIEEFMRCTENVTSLWRFIQFLFACVCLFHSLELLATTTLGW